nr:hypothetical protein [uncultured Roseococcus sp.]
MSRRLVLLAAIGLSACMATEGTSPAAACEMRLVEQARERAGALDIVLLAPPEGCIDPDRQADHGAFVGEVRLTNAGGAPIRVTHATGDIAFLAFRSSAVREEGAGAGSVLSPPPIAPAEVERRAVTLAPGESLSLRSWSRHQDVIEDAMLNRRRLDGEAVPVSSVSTRRFVVTYGLNITLDGAPLNRTYEAVVTARLPGR